MPVPLANGIAIAIAIPTSPMSHLWGLAGNPVHSPQPSQPTPTGLPPNSGGGSGSPDSDLHADKFPLGLSAH